MIGAPANTRVWIVAGHADMRKRLRLAALAQTALVENPFNGHVFVFLGRRGNIIKLLRFEWRCLAAVTTVCDAVRLRRLCPINRNAICVDYCAIRPDPVCFAASSHSRALRQSEDGRS